MTVLVNVASPMRDGVELACDVYLPNSNSEPMPTLLHRTPYDRQTERYVDFAKWFAEHGYVVVVQDVRGRYDSDGDFYPFVNEGPDGADTIEWIADQEWCDGSVGMYGGSYSGWAQWAAARETPVALKALASTAAAGRWGEEVPFNNGVLRLHYLQWVMMVDGRTNQRTDLVEWETFFWHLPLSNIDRLVGDGWSFWRDWLAHPGLDDYWNDIRLSAEDFKSIDIPAIHITGWYDADQPGALMFYEGMRDYSSASSTQKLIIGPWDHAGTRVPKRQLRHVDFGPHALLDVDSIHRQWFDRWLKGPPSSTDSEPAVKYFVTGSNRWEQSATWPPSGIQTIRFYFGSSDGDAGTLQTSIPSAGSHEYDYDPADPVLVMDGWLHYQGVAAYAEVGGELLDRSHLDQREDVIIYETPPLDTPLTIAGRPTLRFFAESDCPDTDWIAWISDHAPDGRCTMLAQGLLRARFRNGLEREELLEPGDIELFEFEMSSIAHMFDVGHSIRLSITSSAFPLYDRNPNTGAPIGGDSDVRRAHNRIHHGRRRPSRIELQVYTSYLTLD